MTDFAYDKVAMPALEMERNGLWRRIFEGLVQARMRQAERFVKEYNELYRRP